jgi:nucleoside-diphosphate-sugar epimerase
MIAIAGGHGKIALQLTGFLRARGETVVCLIRKPEHADDVRAAGGEPVLCDLEHSGVPEISSAVTGASAVVFAAGAGPGSGAERKLTVDRDGAIKLLEAAVAAQVPRYLMISAVGAENPPDGDDVFSVYLRAKAQADAAVQASDRAWVILRPGRLTDDPGTGRVRIDLEPFRGDVPRADIAAVLNELLQRSAERLILYVNAGEVPIPQALDAVL